MTLQELQTLESELRKRGYKKYALLSHLPSRGRGSSPSTKRKTMRGK